MKKKRGRRRHDAEEEENGRRGSGAVLNLKEKENKSDSSEEVRALRP
jgi:hypothetical protein